MERLSNIDRSIDHGNKTELSQKSRNRTKKERKGDTVFVKYYQAEIFKSVGEALNSQISLLIENDNHLREEAKNKKI